MVAAKKLSDAGIRELLILEATPKIGGRLHKTTFGGYAMEMGAAWFSEGGPQQSPLVDIAKSIKLRTHTTEFWNISSNTYKQEGGLYPKSEVEEAFAAGKARERLCANLSAVLNAVPEHDHDISVLGAYHLHKKVPSTPLEMVADYYNNDYKDGQAPQMTSTKHKHPRHELVDHGTNVYFVSDPRGFETVVHHVADQFLDKRDPRLKVNQVAREISYSKKGVTVMTEDGSIFQARYAIVSVSLGVLQSNLISFKPELPMWKRLAISDFTMTGYTKIFLKFPFYFWPTDPGSEIFLYTHEQRGYYPIWKHLENQYPGSNILYVTVTGEESMRIERQSDEATQEEAMKVLRKMFGDKIPDPEAILVTRWSRNRLIKGSFANWPPRYTKKEFQYLKDPVGPVYFTGEYTNEKYMGFATGAYFSGIETANDLINCIKKYACRTHSRGTIA
ncbi:unnamed protein product [Linum tenue]|uniref:Amine oxidase domain-containing protein n=1 Tax=Linum tenue TaxID=586396 RepID=A0AAV0IPM7_9ROSI|nr:unnamed protein product [Linum tenue]